MPDLPGSLYKYRSAGQAAQLLQDLKLAWASPLAFNDPFDVQIQVRLGCTGDEMADAFAPEMLRLLYSDEPLAPAMDSGLAKVLSACRPLARRADRDEVVAAMRPAILEAAQKGAADLAAYADRWPEWLKEARVLCLSELRNDLLMWAHYADCHRGAVIEFNCFPGTDGAAVSAARPVAYRQDIPVMGTAQDWVRHVTGISALPIEDLFETYTRTKSDHWAYEKEWRCLKGNPDGIAVSPLVTLRAVRPEDISAIYLGCRIPPPDRDKLLSLSRTRVRHAAVFQAVQSRTEFKLEFEPLPLA